MVESKTGPQHRALATDNAVQITAPGIEFFPHVMKAATAREHHSTINAMSRSDRAFLAFLQLSCDLSARIPGLYERASNDASQTRAPGLEFFPHVMKATRAREHHSTINAMNRSDRAFLAFLQLSCDLAARLPILYERVARL